MSIDKKKLLVELNRASTAVYVNSHKKLYYIKMIYSNGLTSFQIHSVKKNYQDAVKRYKNGAHYSVLEHGEIK